MNLIDNFNISINTVADFQNHCVVFQNELKITAEILISILFNISKNRNKYFNKKHGGSFDITSI